MCSNRTAGRGLGRGLVKHPQCLNTCSCIARAAPTCWVLTREALRSSPSSAMIRKLVNRYSSACVAWCNTCSQSRPASWALLPTLPTGQLNPSLPVLPHGHSTWAEHVNLAPMSLERCTTSSNMGLPAVPPCISWTFPAFQELLKLVWNKIITPCPLDTWC